MASVAEWVEGARPRTLPAAIAPVVAGLGVTGYTGTDLSAMHVAVAALLALLVALALQIGVNYFNDYSDGVRGTDSVRVGPVRLVGQGLAPASQVKRAALLSLGTAAVLGTALVLVSRQWILLPIGVAAVLAAYGYTGGKHPYGYLGLGDVFVFIFFGPVAVCGTTLVTGGGLWPVAVLASIAIGILTVNILVANNLRDRALDERAGKRTLSRRGEDPATVRGEQHGGFRDRRLARDPGHPVGTARNDRRDPRGQGVSGRSRTRLRQGAHPSAADDVAGATADRTWARGGTRPLEPTFRQRARR